MNGQVKKTSIQLIKYGLVGISNTIVTFLVFVLLNSLFNVNFYVSNIVGYIAGVLNSFLWNKKWVFKTKNTKVQREMLLFFVGFGFCYIVQLGLLWLLMNFTGLRHLQIAAISDFELGETVIAGLGMVVYTLLNYVYNRFITFREKNNK